MPFHRVMQKLITVIVFAMLGLQLNAGTITIPISAQGGIMGIEVFGVTASGAPSPITMTNLNSAFIMRNSNPYWLDVSVVMKAEPYVFDISMEAPGYIDVYRTLAGMPMSGDEWIVLSSGNSFITPINLSVLAISLASDTYRAQNAPQSQPASTPEPTTWAMLVGAFLVLGLNRKFRKQ